jgi:hypothetical protein
MGVWLAKINLVVFNGIPRKPFEGYLALARYYLADVASSGLHVSSSGDDYVVSRLAKGAELLCRARDGFEVGIGLAWLAQGANNTVEIKADSHRFLQLELEIGLGDRASFNN